MPSRIRAVALLAATGLAACAPVKPKPTAFTVPRQEFFPALRTVAVLPLVVPRDLADPEPIRAELDGLIEEQLRGVELRVVPAAELRALQEEAALAQGGLFDPVTGELDATKAQAVDAEVRKLACERFAADAVLATALVVRPAWALGGRAAWDGAFDQPATGPGWWKVSLYKLPEGQLAALSLGVWLTDAAGRQLYSKFGGLQLLARYTVKAEIVPVPRNELFQDRGRSEQAVHLALDELLGLEPLRPPGR